MKVKGDCLCGGVSFGVEVNPSLVFNCHCLRCQKVHGATFATQVIANRKSLKFFKGKELLKDFKTGDSMRAFCKNCGSRLMNYGESNSPYLSVAIAVLENSYQYNPVGDCYAGRKHKFVEINGSITEFAGLPPLSHLHY